MERISQEIKRRTRVASLFPNEAALLRLVSAVLMEVSEEQGARVRETKWEGTGRMPDGLSQTDTLKEFRQRK